MSLRIDDFRSFHAAVHGGKEPFDWQVRLLRSVVENRGWPSVLDLPTGAGKTTCIDIAVFTVALDAESTERWAPRRIAMVIDRRVVVDQVAERGRLLQRALLTENAPTVVREVARCLRSMSAAHEEPLGVYALRGGIPKDNGWARSPDQPLVLASTVDQIGSRIFLQGYGVSSGMRPVHAGLLANDTLLLLDEVHLSRPFGEALAELERVRRRSGGAASLPHRFQHVFLSATPGAVTGDRFVLDQAELQPESPLWPRLHASKPTRIIEVSDRTDLEAKCMAEARRLLAEHATVAIVVNRVASALTVARQLREAMRDAADVVPLTGRMRPLDRDGLVRDLRPRILTGRERSGSERPLIVVGTQCIEAGADFDFDALITEAASLDALRQRFGRVDRLGLYRNACGVIVWDKSARNDPVYGDALTATMKWLKERASKKNKLVDFGVLALGSPPAEQLPGLLAPTKHAPVLLPAYMDLWAQTAPEPALVPDVSLWLHGPSSGPADVQVVWRVDLDDETLEAARNDEVAARPASIVGAVRPTSLEAVSVPFVTARQWLAGCRPTPVSDVEGVHLVEEDDPLRGDRYLALRWRGDDSEVIDAAQLRPGDTIIVPASRGGLRDGSFDPDATEPVRDLAEPAALFARATPVLRTHPLVLKQHGIRVSAEDPEEVFAAVESSAAEKSTIAWRGEWLRALLRGTRHVVVGDEDWIVLRGRRLPASTLRRITATGDTLEDGVELTTDEDDSYHAGRSVTLAVHSADVERHAREYARAIGLPGNLVSDLALAGWLHDIGKADRRFQRMLRGGSEIEYLKDRTPWAKSGLSPDARGEQRLAAMRSGYPPGARHEVQSLAMLTHELEHVRSRANDLDLVLHLVASHHGHCRPFAPVAIEPEPVEVELAVHASDTFGSIAFAATSSAHHLHRLDAEIGDRFWRLVEKYGWLELCWLEAILRLADHRASELEQRGDL